MMRPLDEPIPPDEALYRRLSPITVIAGDAVLPSAIDLPATSVNRAKYSAPAEVLVATRPDQSLIAVIRAGELPGSLPAPAGDPWEFIVADDPQEDNSAHAEIRIKPLGKPYAGRKPSSPAFKQQLRAVLANRMRVMR